jgi:hypothetical protein
MFLFFLLQLMVHACDRNYVGHSISNETNYYCSKTAELIHMKLSGHKAGNLAMTSDQLFNHIL